MSTLDGSPSHTYRHMLTVMQVTQQDLGDYMCVALNVHGKSQQLIQVTGEPNVGWLSGKHFFSLMVWKINLKMLRENGRMKKSTLLLRFTPSPTHH